MRSTLFNVFSLISRRTEELDEARRRRFVKEFPGRYVPPRRTEICVNLLSRINQFARSAAEGHLAAYKLVHTQKVSGSWKVGYSTSCGAHALVSI